MISQLYSFATGQAAGVVAAQELRIQASKLGIPLDVDESFEWLVSALLKGLSTRASKGAPALR